MKHFQANRVIFSDSMVPHSIEITEGITSVYLVTSGGDAEDLPQFSRLIAWQNCPPSTSATSTLTRHLVNGNHQIN
jgi:hypothetical protein